MCYTIRKCKDFSDIFFAVKSGNIKAESAKKAIAKRPKLWPIEKNQEYDFLYKNYPDDRGILSEIWV